MAFKIDYSASQLGKNLAKMSVKLRAAVLMIAATEASRLQAKMQKERPWKDRTGMAKATLRGVVSQPSDNVIRITLSHGVSYGIWLELAKQKKYAIVAPTLQKESPNVLQSFQNFFSKIKL